MTITDWTIVLFYITFLVGFSYRIGLKQKNQEDYYVGGRSVPPWQLGISMAANQVSAISLIGAPAFIALRKNGGLKWLQYELAIPLAMIAIIIFIIPLIRSATGVTIYQYLEKRFGKETRLTLSFIFLLSRSLASGVALLATSYVTSVCTGLDLTPAILLIGIISLIYTALGGIMADIYSDIIQLVVLWGSSFIIIAVLLNMIGTDFTALGNHADRLLIFDPESSGFGDGNSFALWPMLIGGFFLYVSYYGCDQSQAQRLLAASDSKSAQKSLLINAVIRFPLVLTYCAVGVLLIIYLDIDPEFASDIKDLPPDYLMPYFFRDHIPSGLTGLIVAGIFAASMSSLDSAINSLSAATWDDFLLRIRPSINSIPDREKVRFSRIITVFWGFFSTLCAVWMAGGAETVIELVNKIGSAFYGPVAGVFILGFLFKRAGQGAALLGLACGTAFNVFLWLRFESTVSWMWWNMTGFIVTLISGLIHSVIFPSDRTDKRIPVFKTAFLNVNVQGVIFLFLWFILIVALCLIIHFVLF